MGGHCARGIPIKHAAEAIVRSIVRPLRDGPEDVVYALLQAVPAQRLMDIVEQLCAREFGENEPTICYDSGQVSVTRCPLLWARA